MATTIMSVSIPIEYAKFLEETGEKPSKLLQESIKKMIEEHKVSPAQVTALNKQIGFLRETIDTQRNFIKKEGLMDSFYEFEKNNVQTL